MSLTFTCRDALERSGSIERNCATARS
jgi:hypothetical protein